MFTQTVVPEKQKIEIAPQELVKETVVEQKIQHETQQNIGDTIAQNPLIIVAILTMATAILLIWLLWINQRYV